MESIHGVPAERIRLVPNGIDVAVPTAVDRERSRADLRRRIPGYNQDSEAAFTRMFERDKDELRAMGIPIAVEPVPGSDPPASGYRIDRRDYAGQNPNLAADELAPEYIVPSVFNRQVVEDVAAARGAPALVWGDDYEAMGHPGAFRYRGPVERDGLMALADYVVSRDR